VRFVTVFQEDQDMLRDAAREQGLYKPITTNYRANPTAPIAHRLGAAADHARCFALASLKCCGRAARCGAALDVAAPAGPHVLCVACAVCRGWAGHAPRRHSLCTRWQVRLAARPLKERNAAQSCCPLPLRPALTCISVPGRLALACACFRARAGCLGRRRLARGPIPAPRRPAHGEATLVV